MSRIIKDKHLQIDLDLANEITKRAKLKGCSEVDEYNYLLRYSIEFEKLYEVMDSIYKLVNKCSMNSNYNRKLLEQLYADIITDPTNVDESEALNKFRKNIFKGKKMND